MIKFYPDGRKSGRIKVVGKTASYLITDVVATSYSGLKFRIEEVEGSRTEIILSSYNNMHLRKAKDVRFRGDMLLNRMQIREKVANVAEVNRKEVGCDIKAFLIVV